jgi:drug/metabolite transporter (DMT)-like permease
MTPTRRTGILLALVTAVISGFSVFLNSYGVKAFGNPTAYTTAKNVVSALVLLAVVGIGVRAGSGARLTRPQGPAQWGALAAIGVFGGSIPFVLFFEGLSRASSPQAAFLHKTLVLWVAVLAFVFLGERLQWGHWLAIGLLVVGQLGLLGGLPDSIGTPEAMILAATLMWSVEVVVAKKLLGSLSSWTVGVARMGLGSVVLIGWVAVRGDLGLLTGMDAGQLGWVVLTGVLLAGYVATWFAALQRALAVDVTAVLVLAVPITATLDSLVHGTPLSPQLGWLALLVGGGALVVLLAWQGTRRAVPVGG